MPSSIDSQSSIIGPDTIASLYDCTANPETSKVTVAEIGSRGESTTMSLTERIIVAAVASG